jgi:hypothetical protein
MRTHLLVAVALVAAAALTYAASANPQTPVRVELLPISSVAGCGAASGANAQAPGRVRCQYLIDVRLYRTGADGKEALAAAPKVVTTEGEPAYVQIGERISPPNGFTESLDVGFSLIVKIYRNNGKLFLDTSASACGLAEQKADRVCITTTGLRVVEAVTLGQKISVALPDDEKARWELSVYKLPPNWK